MARVIVSMSKRAIKDRLLHIATLGRTIGLSGEMKIHLHTDFVEQFTTSQTFFTKDRVPLTFSYINMQRLTIKIDNIESVDLCKKYVNTKIYTTYERTREVCKLKDEEYFWFDIIGLDIVDSGINFGKVIEIERIGAVDYLLIKHTKEFLLPYHKPFVVSVDLDRGVIYTDGAADLLEVL